MNKIYPFQPVQNIRNNRHYLRAAIRLGWLYRSTPSRNDRLVKRNPSLVLTVNKRLINIRRNDPKCRQHGRG